MRKSSGEGSTEKNVIPLKFNRLIFITLLAIVLFVPLFLLQSLSKFDFWWWMSANLILLISLALAVDISYREFLATDFRNKILKKILFGVTSAVILYLFFATGNFLSRLIFDFADKDISSVYGFKGDIPPVRIFLLMLLIIGPGEELFWRGFLQRNLAARVGDLNGFMLATVVYTGVHVLTGNVLLILAALVAGLFWGWMYMKYRSMLMNIVSHTVWDITVFLLFPFQ